MQTDNVLLHMQIMHIIDAKIHSICIVGEVTVFVSVEELINLKSTKTRSIRLNHFKVMHIKCSKSSTAQSVCQDPHMSFSESYICGMSEIPRP